MTKKLFLILIAFLLVWGLLLSGCAKSQNKKESNSNKPAVSEKTSQPQFPKGRIAYLKDKNEIWIMDPDGSNQKKLCTIEGKMDRVYALESSPNGEFIIIHDKYFGYKRVVNSYTGKITDLSDGDSNNYMMFTPDNSLLIFGGKERTYVDPGKDIIKVDLKTLKRITILKNVDLDISQRPVFSLDNRKIAVPGLLIMNLDGSDKFEYKTHQMPVFFSKNSSKLYLVEGNNLYSVDVSDDNSLSNQALVDSEISGVGTSANKLMVTVTRESNNNRDIRDFLAVDIQVYELGNENFINNVATLRLSLISNGHISPDGKDAVYSTSDQGNSNIYTINNGQITNDLNEETFPVWLPK